MALLFNILRLPRRGGCSGHLKFSRMASDQANRVKFIMAYLPLSHQRLAPSYQLRRSIPATHDAKPITLILRAISDSFGSRFSRRSLHGFGDPAHSVGSL